MKALAMIAALALAGCAGTAVVNVNGDGFAVDIVNTDHNAQADQVRPDSAVE